MIPRSYVISCLQVTLEVFSNRICNQESLLRCLTGSESFFGFSWSFRCVSTFVIVSPKLLVWILAYIYFMCRYVLFALECACSYLDIFTYSLGFWRDFIRLHFLFWSPPSLHCNTHTHTHTHTIYIYILCIYIYIHTHTHIYTHVCVRVCVCVCVCVYIYVCVCIYIYIYVF